MQDHDRFKLLGHTILLRPLSPSLFLNEDEGLPLSVFSIKKIKTMYEKTMEASGIENENKLSIENYLKNIKTMFEKCIIEFDGGEFDYEKYLKKENLDFLGCIMGRLFQISFKMFQPIIEMAETQTIFWDSMAKRYGKTPIECLSPTGKYTDMDAYCFNVLILEKGMQAEYAAQEKALKKMKRKK